jgi:4-cresol dehydrogenase (hydroxylating)
MEHHQAIEAWIECLGTEQVLTESSEREECQTATFFTNSQILAILRPANPREIQDCLKIANQYQIPLYPISRGKNTGYGSKVPPSACCVLLDLGRLDRITDYHDQLGYVTVEAGVTQRQLYQFLQEKSAPFWMDAVGASPEASLVGNVIERGFGHTPYGEHFAHVCGFEVILATGETIHTGFGSFSNAQATPIYRWGVGPHLDGLFSQSNFGIVTRMTIWLMPKPEYFQAFYFSIDRDDQLADLIDALRPLRLNGTLKSAIHIGNDYKVLASIRPYPWTEMAGKTPLSAEILEEFARTWGFGAWNGSGGLYGTRAQVAEARRLVKRALKGKVKKLQFVDDFTLLLLQKLERPYQWLTKTKVSEILKLLKPVYGLMQGIPTATQLGSAYWRKKSLPSEPVNPEKDRCGLIWCAPIAPLDGAAGAEIYEMVQGVFRQYEFEPLISISLLTERCLNCVIAITYDREIPGEDERAIACYDHLMDGLTQAGYYPYRLGIQSMELLAQMEESYQDLLNKLKHCLDPQGILAPGRYAPPDSHQNELT